MLKLYENIKRYRKLAGLTQEDLAKRTGYTDRSSIARIEKGEIDLPQSKIKQFADALGTTPGELLGWDEAEQFGSLVAELVNDPAGLQMVADYMSLGEADQLMVRSLVASLAAKTKKD